ncbi:MAG: hypothetical protein AAFN44_02195 [Pseudomonadota bacterium]
MSAKISDKLSEMDLKDLPDIDDREGIREFAADFNGYLYYGSFQSCAAAAKTRARDSIISLRNELFFSYRASNHLGTDDFVKTYSELLPYFHEQLKKKDAN